MTRVSRALLGHPGMTYRYKDLRLFSFPWSEQQHKTASKVRFLTQLMKLRERTFERECNIYVSKHAQAQTKYKTHKHTERERERSKRTHARTHTHTHTHKHTYTVAGQFGYLSKGRHALLSSAARSRWCMELCVCVSVCG